MTNGIRERLDDARLLYGQGRKSGALLMLLIGVAATARKRYPRDRFRDRAAFTQFIRDELASGRFFAGTKVTETFELKFRGKRCHFYDVLYEYMRCMLVHEATMPEDILFEAGTDFRVRVEPNAITFSDGLLDCLARIVGSAPENC